MPRSATRWDWWKAVNRGRTKAVQNVIDNKFKISMCLHAICCCILPSRAGWMATVSKKHTLHAALAVSSAVCGLPVLNAAQFPLAYQVPVES